MAYLTKKRQISRRAMKAFRHRMREAGWSPTVLWIPTRVKAQITAEAKRLGILERALMRTAIETGLRRLSVSEVQAHDREWRAVTGPSMASMLKSGQAVALLDSIKHRFIGVEVRSV